MSLSEEVFQKVNRIFQLDYEGSEFWIRKKNWNLVQSSLILIGMNPNKIFKPSENAFPFHGFSFLNKDSIGFLVEANKTATKSLVNEGLRQPGEEETEKFFQDIQKKSMEIIEYLLNGPFYLIKMKMDQENSSWLQRERATNFFNDHTVECKKILKWAVSDEMGIQIPEELRKAAVDHKILSEENVDQSDKEKIKKCWEKISSSKARLTKEEGLELVKSFEPEACNGKTDQTILDYMKLPNSPGRPRGSKNKVKNC